MQLILLQIYFPIYILRIFWDKYVTHTYIYRWNWTIAYSTGQLPAGFLIFSWISIISLLIYKLRKVKQNYVDETSISNTYQYTFKTILESFLYIFVNTIIISLLNIFYIISYSSPNLSSANLILIQILFVFLKMFWYLCCLPLFDLSKQSKRLKIFIFTLNSVFIPCIVTALTSPSCYQVFFHIIIS